MKRDTLFFLILSLIAGNLAWWTGSIINALYHTPSDHWYWAKLLVDIVGIVAVLYLMRTYMKGRKLTKEQEKKEPDR